MKISCEVIKDLMPLCYEDIASVESKVLVKDHCKECESCAQAYGRMSDDEIKIEDNGSGLKQFLKNCKKNSNAVLALCCYSILVIFGIVDGIIVCDIDPTAGADVMILYAWFLFPLAGLLASVAIARHKLGLKYIFPVICGLVVVSYPHILFGRFVIEIEEIFNFMWGFVPAVIGFVVGMIRGRVAKDKIGVVNEGMVAGLIVTVVAVLFVLYLPTAWLLCLLVGGAGVVVFVVSLMLRVRLIKKKKMGR